MMRLIDADRVEQGFKELCQSPCFKGNRFYYEGADVLMDLCIRTDSHKDNTVDATPIIHAKWLEKTVIYGSMLYYDFVCSNCNNSKPTKEHYEYCHHCGAKMDLDDA